MRIHVSKKLKVFLIVNLALILLEGVCCIVFFSISCVLPTLNAAERWQGSGEMRFAQIACFMPEDEAKSKDDILEFRRTLNQKLTEASLVASENGSLYRDAYSASASLNVYSDRGSSVRVKAIGTGGDFFLFHPLKLVSGNYIYESDLMQDGIVVDEALAWMLFGSTNVAGQSVLIENQPFYIAGVVQREDDFATSAAYLDGAGMFMSYDALSALREENITCYEIVLPNMISGFGMNIMEENFFVGLGEITENSSRYSIKNLLRVAGSFAKRTMRNNGVIYPYWENAVRLTETYLSVLLVLMILLLACPAVTAIVLLIIALVKAGKTVKKKIPAYVEGRVEKKREARYLKQNGDENG